MSGLLDDLAAAPDNARRTPPRHPDGWEPGVEWNGRTGEITSRPLAEPSPDWDALLRVWGFDPAVVEVVDGTVQVRSWDAAIGDGNVRTMWYYRASLRERRAAGPDLDALITEIKRHKPKPRLTAPEIAGSAFIYAMSDPQLGKRGTGPTVERILDSYSDAAKRIRELRKIGRQIDSIYFLGLGDIVEGCKDHYAMQQFEVELDKRAQVRLGRRLWIKGVETFAPLAAKVICAGIGGNHGEERSDGKAFTTFGDNADVAIIEQAGEIIAANPSAYGHVRFVVPQESLTLTLDIAGTITGLAHGHQARKGGKNKVREWWKGQMFGMRPVGDATLLLTGHMHHLSIDDDGPRTHIQAPTIDSGSQWWEESAGIPSAPATLTLMVGPNGWDDLKLL